MKYSERFKKNWWIAILVLITLLLFLKKTGVVSSHFINESQDMVLLIIWLCLILIPLFGEIDIFGVKLKREIEEVKSKIYEIKTAINNNNTFNPTVYFHASKDEVLDEKISQITQKSVKGKEELNFNFSDNELYLFKLRISIEKELRRIFAEHSEFNNSEIRFESVSNFIQNLKAKELLDGKLFMSIKELIAISNLGIHGEKVTEKQLYFAKIFGPKVLEDLKMIK